MFDKRVTLFMGHYGSGKTFVSVNYALALKKLGKKVSVYDLDIVNPYFRTVDAEKTLLGVGTYTGYDVTVLDLIRIKKVLSNVQ